MTSNTKMCLLLVRIAARIKTNPALGGVRLRSVDLRLPKTAVQRGFGALHSTESGPLFPPRLDIVKHFSALECVSGISTSARTSRPTTEGPVQSARGVMHGSAKSGDAGGMRRMKRAAGGSIMAEPDELDAPASGSSVQAHHTTVSQNPIQSGAAGGRSSMCSR